ncbi:hypothetical protein LMG22037_06205 [Paraburkholderia phenoliruptrix]|uniref:Uncharacterized protein n=1 Tax=Paraburkholderia phenoliruptrix TaxID=252970 RepID=A0A6J5CKX9_9BURK|nr:hypothetical protein LMG22037_06205 [Paraburkholderia phenoliruptrix]
MNFAGRPTTCSIGMPDTGLVNSMSYRYNSLTASRPLNLSTEKGAGCGASFNS